MDTIIEYLKHPMAVGVYSYTALLDFSELGKYLNGFTQELANRTKTTDKNSLERVLLEHRISQLEEALKKHNVEKGLDYFQSLTNVLYALYDDDKENPEIRNIFVDSFQNDSETRPSQNIFRSHLINQCSDVVVIDKKHVIKEKWLFDFMSVKSETIHNFKQNLGLIPTLKNNIEDKNEKRHFSTRYVFRPYPYVIQLLLEDKSTVPIPNDLKDFLNAAIHYYFSGEWRTSIVLSAITIESILADLYEEYNHHTAPDTPLGDLLKKVSAKCQFTNDILEKLEIANNARIAAVHRSSLPVSDKDAINALVGATNIILMTHASGPITITP